MIVFFQVLSKFDTAALSCLAPLVSEFGVKTVFTIASISSKDNFKVETYLIVKFSK